MKSLVIKFLQNKKSPHLIFDRGSRTDISTHFEGYNRLMRGAHIYKSLVGLGTYIAGYTHLENVQIGRFCSIGQSIRNRFGVHPTSLWASAHPAFYSTKKQAGFSFVSEQKFEEHKFIDAEKRYYCKIGNDVWIGNDVKILDGVTIGDGAVVAMGSIVNKDVAPFSVVGGIPAKHLKYRFTPDQIEAIQGNPWWEKDINWLRANCDFFSDIDALIKRLYV